MSRIGTKVRLNQRILERKPGKTVKWLGDSIVPGLYVRVTPKGHRSFYARYRDTVTGQQVKRKLGVYPFLSIQQARRMVHALRAEVFEIDELISTRKQAPTVTLNDLYEEYFDEWNASSRKKALTIKTDRSRYQSQVSVRFGKTLVHEITHVNATEFIHKLKRGNQGRTAGMLSSFFNYLLMLGVVTKNPFAKIKVAPPRTIHRYFDETELRQLARGLEHLEMDGENPIPIALIRCLLITGRRVGELRELRWRNVNFHAQIIEVEDGKVGAQTHPVSEQFLSIVDSLRRENSTPDSFVFHGMTLDRPYMGMDKFKRRLHAVAPIAPWRIHDLRHNFASQLVNQGTDLYVVKELLGHRSYTSTQRYAHLGPSKLRDGLQVVEDQVPLQQGEAEKRFKDSW